MNVVMVGQFDFPRGSASAARIRHLALGLKRNGARVHVITMVPKPANGAPPAMDGDHEGVSWECASPVTARVSGWRDAERSVPRLRRGLADRVRWFAGLYGAAPRAARRLAGRMEGQPCDLVIVYDRSAVRMAPLARLCRARGVPCVLDVTETNEQLGRRLTPLYWDFALGARLSPRLFDGVTVITTGLERLYRGRGCPRTLVVPAVEEWPRPAPPAPPTGNPEFRLAYVGALLPRDAPGMLLDVVRDLASRGLRVSLDVIGHYEGTPRGRDLVRRCDRDPVLTRVVRLLGSLSDERLAARLAGADGLVLTRRDARTEVLSFPTRLVEHLRHGRPVFVSAVGDVPRYLRHGQEAVLLDPSDPQRAAAAMEAVIRREDRGAAIGRAGRETGALAFDRDVHAARILEFADTLRQGGHA